MGSRLLAMLLVHAAMLLHTTCQQVQVTELPDPFQHAQSDADMELLYRTCLDPDLAMHAGKRYTLRDLAATLEAQKAIKYYKHLSLVVVKDHVMHVATLSPSKQPPSPTPRRVRMTVEAVHNATLRGVTLPDSLFILSTWDEPRCPTRHPARCPAPILSLIKTWQHADNTSDHADILVPFFNHVYQDVTEYPWELKTRKALMRAAMQNGMPPNNTRLNLVRLASTPEGAHLLDAGITHNLKVGMRLETVPQVSIPDHAKWRYLISADGFTASCRLGKLLGINSVIVKELTRWVEYYYRALSPGTHYAPFVRANALSVLEALDRLPDSQLQEMTRRAQEFQQMYLSQHAKVLYLRRVIQRYMELFPSVDMQRFIAALDPTRLNDVDYLIGELKRAP